MKSEAEAHSGLPFFMISYSYGTRTVILVLQKQLFLWYKNSYSCITKTVIIRVQE